MNVHKTRQVLEHLKAVIEDVLASGEIEPLRTATQMVKLHGVSRSELQRLKREGRLQTYEGGKKYRYSEYLVAVKDPLPEPPQPISVTSVWTRPGDYPSTFTTTASSHKIRAIN